MRKATGIAAILLLTGSSYAFAQLATPGEIAPPLQYQTSLDSTFTPDSYKNKLLVIDFWATWCAPCVASAPHINELAQQFKSSAAFVAMSNEKQATVAAYFKKSGKVLQTYHLLDSTRKTMNSYGVNSIPYCAVIDQQGILRWTGHSAALTAAILDTALSRKWNPALDHVQLENVAQRQQKATFANENTVWAFSIAKTSDTTASSTTTTTTATNGWTSEMEVGNTSLTGILFLITGFTPDRIETNKPALISGKYDLIYKAAQPSDIAIQQLNKQLIPGKASANSLLNGLSNALGFTATLEKKQKKYYSLIVTDAALLAKHTSANTGSSSSFKPPFSMVFSGFSLTAIAASLNGIMNASVLNSQAETGIAYDIELDISSTETRIASLKKYGLMLKEETGKLDTLIISFAD